MIINMRPSAARYGTPNGIIRCSSHERRSSSPAASRRIKSKRSGAMSFGGSVRLAGAKCSGRPEFVIASAPIADSPPASRDAMISQPTPVRTRFDKAAPRATAPLTPVYTELTGSGL